MSKLEVKGKTVVLDCITLWLTNFYMDTNFLVEDSYKQAKAEWDLFSRNDMELIVISNEIGMGGHAETPAGRKFADLQGMMNQYIAKQADAAFLMVSGIPLKIK